jgi:hypothetical protein
MGKKTRKEKAIEMMSIRLQELERKLLSSPQKYTDAEYENLTKEAIQARELIRILKEDPL